MWQLAAALGEITLRRRGPEILPDSTFLVGLLLGVYVAMALFDLLLHGALTWSAVGNVAAQMILLFAFVFAALTFFKLERRFRQTVSALIGINIVIYCVFLPLAIAGLVLNLDPQTGPLIWLRIGFFLWAVLIEATVFARALSQPLLLGFMFEILYVLPSLSISEYFAPPVE